MVDLTQQLEAHRVPLTGYCYRMLGSVVDADDATQDTLVRAWRGMNTFDERSSLRTWLYKIATNVCLDALSARSRRERPIDLGAAGTTEDDLATRPREHWLEPIPDARAVPADADPAQQLFLKESIRLAFVAAVQYLAPKQRAVLLLTDVLGCSAADVAECLQTTVASVNSALQRARATLADHRVTSPPVVAVRPEQEALVAKYMRAFERYDVDALTLLMREDATLSMPPHSLWLRGRDNIHAWLLGRGSGCRGSRLVRTEVAGAPAFAQYRDGGKVPFAVIVLDIVDGEIAGMTSFLDTDTLFPLLNMPPVLT